METTLVPDNMNTDKNKLKDELERVQRDLAVLYDISNAMRTTLELNHVLYIILTGVTAHFGLGFNRAMLFLVNMKDSCLECKMFIGPESGEHAKRIWEYMKDANPDLDELITTDKIPQTNLYSTLSSRIRNFRIPLNSEKPSLLQAAYLKGDSIHIKRDAISQYIDDPLFTIFSTNELVIMPLKAKDKVKGLIVADNLYTQKPISQEDLRIFTMLANQAGLAIENSQLYEMVVQKSHTDSLTNLWNHGYFQHQLALELDKSRQSNSPLSLAVIDIDNFKHLNDTYGHQYGDIILKELAENLKKLSREADHVCRYGGEEFSIILTNTNKEQSLDIAERIRQSIENQNFSDFLPKKDLKITVSIGLASYPTDAGSKEELITKADKAMYIAKFSGKNRICATQVDENSF